MAVATLFVLIAALFVAGPSLESRLLPVTTHAVVTEEVEDATGVLFFVNFVKRRQCEFLGLAWYIGARRVPVDFTPTDQQRVLGTRPAGPQEAGPWHLPGVRTLEGTQAWALHRCHPLWLTVTEFYHP
jgi:hypothetical protein